MRKRILDQPIDIISHSEAMYRILTALNSKRQFKIITLNPEMIVYAKDHFEFQAAINNAQMIVADGAGIVWALKKKGIENLERIPGIELSEKILKAANELGRKVSFFGSTNNVLNLCIEKLKANYPNIEFTKSMDGFQGDDKDREVAQEIAKDNPDVLFVALGTPRQEVWINKYSYLFPNTLMIGVGGTLDVWSGIKKRAPGWMIDLNLEWLYRILSEPKRISRFLKSHPKFIQMVLQDK